MAEGVTTSVVGKVVESLFGVAKKEISYIWNYNDNVGKFRNEATKLKHMRGRVQQLINLAKEKGEDLLDGVQEWVDKADTKISRAEEFLAEEANSKKTCFSLQLCVNLGSFHHYGKKASNIAPSLLEHQEDGKPFESHVSIPTCIPGFVELYQRKNLDDIDTQKMAIEEIITSIKDEKIQIIGIYGIGGVGKTTLAKEVAATVNSLFAGVVFITVSQTVDIKKIEKEVEAAAKRIIKGEKFLIILDDVWGELKLDEVGIPCGINHMNCKILLTTRKRDVCVAMNAQSEICVDSLPEEEGWILFKRVVGQRVESDPRLKKVAVKVVEECGGLPLIIQAVGKALKDKSIILWETALAQLKKHAPSDIAPDIRKAFTHLKLSYDLLESEEAKSCFLLCSMFPEDYDIPLESLVYYGVGLEKFNDLDSMEDAKNRVQLAVNTLKSSCLLLDERNGRVTKMHDVVRDVALLIASKDNKFLVMAGKDLTEWQPRNKILESYTGISLMKNKISKLPDYELQFPLLDIFLIQKNYDLSVIPDEFILGVKGVRVLDLEDNNILTLPQSLKQLTGLRMLNLCSNSSLHEVSILGELKTLEILILSYTGIKEIPQEIGQLVNLRHLEVKHCYGLSYIAPGVISKLRWLEELHIGYYSVEKGNYNSLEEIHKLSKLTFLDLFVKNAHQIPDDYHFGTLKGFVIQIGGTEHLSGFASDQYSKGYLILEIPIIFDSFMSMKIKNLITVSRGIFLDSIFNIRNILLTHSYEDFGELKSMVLSKCLSLLCLVDSTIQHQCENFLPSKGLDGGKFKKKFLSEIEYLKLSELHELKVIWNCPDQFISLNNLVTLDIFDCPKLIRLFSFSVAQGLFNLQEISIKECKCLEEVISDGDEESGKGEIDMVLPTPNIVFPCLTQISLFGLHNLKSFYPGNSIIKYPSLVKVEVHDCDRMDKWCRGTYDTPKLKYVNNVNEPSTIDEGLAKCREDTLPAEQLEATRAALRFMTAVKKGNY